jgi:hypothetical protein
LIVALYGTLAKIFGVVFENPLLFASNPLLNIPMLSGVAQDPAAKGEEACARGAIA